MLICPPLQLQDSVGLHAEVRFCACTCRHVQDAKVAVVLVSCFVYLYRAGDVASDGWTCTVYRHSLGHTSCQAGSGVDMPYRGGSVFAWWSVSECLCTVHMQRMPLLLLQQVLGLVVAGMIQLERVGQHDLHLHSCDFFDANLPCCKRLLCVWQL